MSVVKKLNEARTKFHALELKKSGLNKFAGYSYFELADFLVPALRIFNEVGLCAFVSFDKELATMTICDVDGSEAIKITSPLGSAALKGCHEIQNIGACETYCRRYLWVAALEIVEHDALDATTGKTEKKDGVSTDVSASGPAEAFKSLQPEQQTLARKAAPKIDGAMPEIPVVMERMEWWLSNFDPADRNDAEAAMFHLLDSKTRSAIKAHQKEIAK